MALDDVVSVQITLESAAVSSASFGIPLIAAYHTATTNRVDTYEAATALTSMLEDGHLADSIPYKSVQAILSANPRVQTVKVGRRDAAAGSMAQDLAAIRAADDTWYGLLIDTNSDADIEAAAEWAEANKLVFAATLHGTEATDAADTDDVASHLKAEGYERTFSLYHSDVNERAADSWMGEMLPSDPSYGNSWNFKTLSGVAVEKLSAQQLSALTGKNVNVYVTKGGVNVTRSGYMAKSTKLFIDQVTLIDEITARIQERVFALLLTDMPYSNTSADRVCGEILAVLYQRIDRGSLLNTPPPTCTHPDVATVSPTDRAARHLPDIVFTAQTAGRIHSVSIIGKLSV